MVNFFGNFFTFRWQFSGGQVLDNCKILNPANHVTVFTEEEKLAAWEAARLVATETEEMKEDIDIRLGLSAMPRGRELLDLAAQFYRSETTGVRFEPKMCQIGPKWDKSSIFCRSDSPRQNVLNPI